MTKKVFVFTILLSLVLFPPINIFSQEEKEETEEFAEIPGEVREEMPAVPAEEYPIEEAGEEPAATQRVEPERTPAPVKKVAQAAVPAGSKKQISDTVTLELKNMDVVEVIKLLSSKGGYDVVVSQNVRGRITLFLDNVPIWDAMQIVFKTTDLAYTKHGDIMRIVTEREYEQQYGRKFNDTRDVKIVPLKNASANDIGRELKQLKSRIGNIIEDDRTNSIIILDTADSTKLMEETITKLDIPVETKVFELIYTPAKGLEEMLKKIISKKGILHVDDLTNKIIITDTPDVLKQVDTVIKEYDKTQYLQTKIFSLNHAKFDKVEEKIKDLLTKDVGIIKSDERTNKVVVTDLPEKISEIEKIIEAYDERSRQVLIEAKIVQVALNDEFRMGINWQLVLNKVLIEKMFRTDTIDMTLSSVYGMLSEYGVTDTTPFDYAGDGSTVIGRGNYPGGRSLITGTLKDGNDIDAIIDILKTAGRTNLLSSPRVLAVNNQEATIRVITRQAFITNTVVQSTGTSSNAQNVTFIEVGVKLTVTPTIGQDGYITLKIKPEVSNVVGYGPPGNNTIPIVATQEAETVIMAKDGSTVVMGGLIEEQQKKTTQKIPILGSIPILGIPFRKETNELDKSELVLFLTPHLATGDVDLNTPGPEIVEYLENVEKERQKASADVDYSEKPAALPAAAPVEKKEPAKNFNKRR